MRLLPRFREERILREQVALVYRNYYFGVIGLFVVITITITSLYFTSRPHGLMYWLIAAILVCFIPLIRYSLNKNKLAAPAIEARKQVIEIFCMGLLWAACPIFFSEGDSTIVMVTITAFTTGLTAAALTMQAPVLPVYLAFSYTVIPALIISLLLLGGVGYFFMAIATIVFLITVTVFGINYERTIKDSIELRFANLELIEQLRQAMTETEEANRAKSVFLASASHDLRQPLHAMGLFIETLSGTELNQQQKEVISHITNASEATREMLNTLLDFSKLDAGVIEAVPIHFRLQTLFNKLENELASSADLKGLIYRTRETPFVVHTDMVLVELVLRNLITNAIRYTDKGGVLVGCRLRNDQVIVEVWDTGIGIPDSEQENIFKEFHQIGNPERDRQKGFGLGLAIVNGLVNNMSLELSFSSRQNKGSVFRISLPLSNAAIVNDLPNIQTLELFDQQQIIIIDDDESIRIAMDGLLTTWGCHCLLAESEIEAINLIKKGGAKPDLVIADYRLREERTGREAIAAIRELVDSRLPAIIITGDTAADRLREAQSVDAMLLHKPVSASELQRAMSSLIGTSGARKPKPLQN